MPGILPVTGFYHMGVVVKDYQSCIENYARIFGIEQWEVRELSSEVFPIDTVRIRGKRAKVNFWSVLGIGRGGLAFEFCEPRAGDNSLYAEFLEEKGEGIHHFFPSLVMENDFYGLCEDLEKRGLGFCQSNGISDDMTCHYIDTTSQLGAPLEIIVLRNENPRPGVAPTIRSFGPEVTRSSRLPMDKLYHYSVVTDRPVDDMKKDYEDIFGMDRWYDYENIVGTTVRDVHYRGRQVAESGFRTWSGRQGPLGVEMVEPLAGKSIFRDMLDDRGPGIHHIMTTLTSDSAFNGTLDWLASLGMSVAQDAATPDGNAYIAFVEGGDYLPGINLEIICQRDGVPRPSGEAGSVLTGD